MARLDEIFDLQMGKRHLEITLITGLMVSMIGYLLLI